VAPGRRADLALFRDLQRFEAAAVLRDGRAVRLEAATSARPPAGPVLSTVTDDVFHVSAEGPRARIAIIDRPRFTRWAEREVPVECGRVAPPSDLARIAVIHRHGRAPAAPRLGFLGGWGTWRGAFATTVSHDSHNLTVFGGDPVDMAAAANALIASGGGMAAVRGGCVTAHLPLPICGLVSDGTLDETARAFAAVRAAMDAIVDWQPPYLTFKALVGATLACNAGPHQTDLGIADPLAERLLTSPILDDGLPR
ncbi:MAG: adenine deaminase C-terminal domain-containing protein, partial [Pseudomonadota bacterium]